MASKPSTNRRKSGKAAPPATPNKHSSTNGTSSYTPTTATVTLKVNALKLRSIVNPSSIKETSAPKVSPPASQAGSASASASASGPAAPTSNNGETVPGTPAAAGTPVASQVVVPGAPVADQPKKKGTKRAAPGEGRARGKPGPKKKARLEDGSIDPSAPPRASHKLGPKASLGAINAGLRALDRSGKPTRKWTKGSFKLKSFTGEVWEINRWRTNPKPPPVEPIKEESAMPVSAEGSNKENKVANGQKNVDKARVAPDVKMEDAPKLAATDCPASAVNGTGKPAAAPAAATAAKPEAAMATAPLAAPPPMTITAAL